jgi:cobalt-zinc-cadmium efflux system outer membrane protein
MRGYRRGIWIVTVMFFLAGCAAVTTDREWNRVTDFTREKLGHEAVWQQSESEKLAIQKDLDGILGNGLSREEAVRIALINNRDLQRTFEDIGISKSDLVQAGLFTNPSLDALFRFPSGGGRTNIEAGVLFSLSDIWQIPVRKKVARARMEATIMRVGQMVLETAAEARRAFDSVYYLSKGKTETEQILERFREIGDQTIERRDFGFMSDQDVFLAQIRVFEAELELTRLQKELEIARAHLSRVLGLQPSQADYRILGEEPEEIRDLPDVEKAVEHALSHRLDVRMAQFGIEEAQMSLDLEKRRIFRHVGLGASYEKETEGTDLVGPSVDIQVPLFDQNQARISRAEYRVRQAEKGIQALEGQVREEITSDLKRIELFRERAKGFRERIIPLRERILGYAEEWVGAMQLRPSEASWRARGNTWTSSWGSNTLWQNLSSISVVHSHDPPRLS